MTYFIISLSLFLVFWQGPIIAVRAYRNVGVSWFSFLMFAIGCVGTVAYLMGLY